MAEELGAVMKSPLVYADLQNLDGSNRPRLTCAGTLDDLARQHIQLQQGLRLTLYMDDADDEGRPDNLLVEGTVQFNSEEDCWVAALDWSALRHASDELPDTQNKIASANGPANRGS